MAEAQGSRFDFLLGRRTYDLWSSFWPKVQRLFFSGVDARELALVSTKTTPTGVLMNTYRHVGSLPTAHVEERNDSRTAGRGA